MGSNCGEQFTQNDQELHKNYKINILGAKQWGVHGGQANFFGLWGGIPQFPPLEETLTHGQADT